MSDEIGKSYKVKVEQKPPPTYKYLNMDSQEFVKSNAVFAAEFRGKRHLLRVIPSAQEYNQILVAAGMNEFSARQAVATCRKLTGVIPK